MLVKKTRIELLGLLAKHLEYKGGEDLAAIKSHLAAQKITKLEDAEGNEIDLDGSWENVERKSFKFPTSEPSTKARDMSRMDAIVESHEAPAGIVKGRREEMLKKAYNQKAARGLTVFGEGDLAEYTAASFRYEVFNQVQKDYSQKARDLEIITKAQSVYTNTGGGSLIDPQILAGMLYSTEPAGAAGKLANIVTMTSESTWAKRKTGIFSLSHRLPTGQYASTQNSYDNVLLTARDMGGIIDIPQNLIDDAAISVADDLAATCGEARDIREDTDFILGDGSATYGNQVGLANALPTAAYISGAGNSWSALTLNDHLGLIGSVQNVKTSRLAWLASRQYYVQVMCKLALAAGGTRPQDIGQGVVVNGIKADAMFLGFPVVFEENNMAVASGSAVKSTYFGDFVGGSMIGRRTTLEVASSEHFKFDTGFVSFRVRARGCVNICGDGRVPATTYGPIVCLKTT